MKKAGVKNIIRFAFIFSDCVLFSLLVFLPIRILLFEKKSLFVLITVFVGILGLVLLLRFQGEKRNMQRKVQERKKRLCLEEILLKSDEELSHELNIKKFMLIRKRDADMFDLFEAIRKGAESIGLRKATKEARELLQRYCPEMNVLDLDEILVRLYPDQIQKQKTGHPFIKIFEHFPNKYLLSGLVLLVASFLFHYKLYLRLFSSICFAIFAISRLIKKQRTELFPFVK